MPSIERVRRFYDQFGAKQDDQSWYEDPPIEVMLGRGAFAAAHRMVEFGCGTGRLAARLLSEAPAARYEGFDVSSTMIKLAQTRLADNPNAHFTRTSGDIAIPVENETADRVVATYVLDILPRRDIRQFLTEAARIAIPGALLCVVNLTWGTRPVPLLASALWSAVHSVAPMRVGGCRPISITSDLQPLLWRIRHTEKVRVRFITSEVTIAERLE